METGAGAAELPRRRPAVHQRPTRSVRSGFSAFAAPAPSACATSFCVFLTLLSTRPSLRSRSWVIWPQPWPAARRSRIVLRASWSVIPRFFSSSASARVMATSPKPSPRLRRLVTTDSSTLNSFAMACVTRRWPSGVDPAAAASASTPLAPAGLAVRDRQGPGLGAGAHRLPRDGGDFSGDPPAPAPRARAPRGGVDPPPPLPELGMGPPRLRGPRRNRRAEHERDDEEK